MSGEPLAINSVDEPRLLFREKITIVYNYTFNKKGPIEKEQ
jgi:hypothetical protein